MAVTWPSRSGAASEDNRASVEESFWLIGLTQASHPIFRQRLNLGLGAAAANFAADRPCYYRPNSAVSHSNIFKQISETHEAFGRQWWYRFRELPRAAEPTGMPAFIASHFSQLAPLTSTWNDQVNSEWITRHYLAGKAIMASTLYLNTAAHCERTNARLPLAYLRYYAVFHTMKAVMLTSPLVDWKQGGMLEATHSKAINVACDRVSLIYGTKFGTETKERVLRLKAERELLSYWLPTTGDHQLANEVDEIALCRLFAEMAQLQSEILEQSLIKNGPQEQKFTFDHKSIETWSQVEIDGHLFTDQDDRGRLDYIARRQPLPINVLQMIPEGHVDDFFGAWTADEPDDGQFDPDEDKYLIFSFP